MKRVTVHNLLATQAEPELASAELLGRRWLTKLRWWLILGQVWMWWMSKEWLELDVQTWPALAVTSVMALSNLVLLATESFRREALVVGVVLCLDVVFLTAFLFFTGREASPFSAFYIVNVATAARVASPRVTALVWSMSTAAFGTLFFGTGHSGAHMAHYRGMWVAYSLSAALAAYFVSRVSIELQERDRRIETLRRASHAAQRLAATSTLAASAAHELGTPHGTIAVLAEGIANGASVPERFREDADVILAQIARCKDIVRDLDGQTAASGADAWAQVSLPDVLSSVLFALDQEGRVSLDAVSPAVAWLPARAFSRVVSSLVKNALDAGAKKVAVRTHEDTTGGFSVAIADDGPGIPEAILERLGEPYLTTKPVGVGSGLGLYLSAVFAESLGGSLDVESAEGQGTRVTLKVPRRWSAGQAVDHG
jgi:two-component system, sensor histidine kinase RegB